MSTKRVPDGSPLLDGDGLASKDEVRLALGPLAVMLVELQERIAGLEERVYRIDNVDLETHASRIAVLEEKLAAVYPAPVA